MYYGAMDVLVLSQEVLIQTFFFSERIELSSTRALAVPPPNSQVFSE